MDAAERRGLGQALALDHRARVIKPLLLLAQMRHRRLGQRVEGVQLAVEPQKPVRVASSAVKAHRSAAGGKGEKNQAIGRSRGGRSTKIHALTDAQCRPLAFMLTGGQVADCTAGALLLEQLPDCDILHADKGYDANAIERVFRRIKDFRRIATRYDRNAANFLAAVCIAAAICYWL